MGIFLGLLAAAVPSLIKASMDKKETYLKLVGPEPDEKMDPEGKESANGQPSVMEQVWACGGRDFSAALPTHAVEVAIPIKPENFKILDCTLKAAKGINISVTISDREL